MSTPPLSLQAAATGYEILHNPRLSKGPAFTEAERRAVAAKAVAEQVTEEKLAKGLIYPPQSRIFEASLHVAGRVAAAIFDIGLVRVPKSADIDAHIRAQIYRPVYPA